MSKLVKQTREVIGKIAHFSLEEKITQTSLWITALGCFLPWLTLESLTEGKKSFTALQFNTSTIGTCILGCTLFIIALVLVPTISNKNIIKLEYRQYVRFHLSALSTILILAILSVFTKLTWESSQISIRFGIYVSLIGSLVATVYTWQIWIKKIPTYTTLPLKTSTLPTEAPNSTLSSSTPSVESHYPLRK